MKKEEFPLFESGRPYTWRPRVPHMGCMVLKVVRKQRHNGSALAAMIGITPAAASKLFRKPFLHSKLLLRLSASLNYDFFAHLCQCPRESVEAVKSEVVKLEGRIGEFEKENEVLRKENGMLEKMVRLLEKGKEE